MTPSEQKLTKRMKAVEKTLAKVHQDVDYFASKLCKKIPTTKVRRLKKRLMKRVECLIVDCNMLAQNKHHLNAMVHYYHSIKYESEDGAELAKGIGIRANQLCTEYERFMDRDFRIIRGLVKRIQDFNGNNPLNEKELKVLMVHKQVCKSTGLQGIIELDKETRRLKFSKLADAEIEYKGVGGMATQYSESDFRKAA